MGILDSYKEIIKEGNTLIDSNDSAINEKVARQLKAINEEVARQMKAIADYDANPEILDSQIKFNPEEFDFNEKKISQQLYIDEDDQYPEADNPEELLKETLGDEFANSFEVQKCDSNKVRIKVNKNQCLDNYEIEYQKVMNRDWNRKDLTSTPLHDFDTEDVTMEELMEYISKGYGIKINC